MIEFGVELPRRKPDLSLHALEKVTEKGICERCLEVKDVIYFYNQNTMPRSIIWICKDCLKTLLKKFG